MKEIIRNLDGPCCLIKPSDILFLIVGFMMFYPSYIKKKGYEVFMLALKGQQKQLTIKQTDKS